MASILVFITGVKTTSIVDVSPQNEIIYYFAGNEFILKEGNDSYQIYKDNIFIEASKSSNSPYYKQEGDRYYLGPSNYFVCKDQMVTNIFTNDVYPITKFNKCSYEHISNVQTKNNTTSPDGDRTYIDLEGFTVIKEANYFRNLTQFPMNWFGECGVIALSELLGYYDTFYNDDFIQNDLTYNAR